MSRCHELVREEGHGNSVGLVEAETIRKRSGSCSKLVRCGDLERKHSYTYYVFMKNVTLAIDESLLREARRIAADRSTTLNAMIREYLQGLAERESKAARARERIVDLCRNSRAEVGQRTWTREDLHER